MRSESERRRRHRNERIVAVVAVALLIAGLVAFYRWNAAEDERFRREKTYIPKPLRMTPEIQLLQEYVRIDTSNPPGDVRAGAKWLTDVLARNGVRAEVIEPAPGRANVYARIKGKRPGEALLLLNHIDVVPADPRVWSFPPFGGEIRLDTLYGRGALDMKSIAICQLAAFLDVAHARTPPEHDVAFLAVADEETGGTNGMGWLVEHRPELFDGIRYALGEGGITEMIADKLTYYGIEVGTKQYARLTLEADAPGPLVQARALLQPRFGWREPERILPEVRTYFRFIAPTRRAFRRDLADVDGAVTRGDFWRLPKPYRDLTQTILSIDWPHGSNGRWLTTVHLLMLPDEDPKERVAWVRRHVETLGVRVRVEMMEPHTPISSHDTPLFRIIAGEAQREYGAPTGTQILHQSSNDSRFLRRIGIDCYGLSPYPVDAFQSATFHGVGEQIRLDRFVHGVELVRRIVRTWTTTP
jgi:acetylornithine deacetylase/succinyl-diaminopimelate desuccinylase-like protein